MSAGAGRRSDSQYRRAADRTQSPRLRSVPHPERIRGPGRRAPSRPAACSGIAPRTGRSRNSRHRVVGYRQFEDRGRAHRAGALAHGRRAAPRQLWPAFRRTTVAAGASWTAAGRRRHDACPEFSATCCRCRPSCSPKRRCWPRTPTKRSMMNFVRKHALAFQAKHGGDLDQAALRVFSNADGAYGANVNHTGRSRRWKDEDELAEAYVRRKGFAYGVDRQAVAARRGARPHARERRRRLSESRFDRARGYHGRPLFRHARRHQPRGSARARGSGDRLYRRPNARRRHGAHALRAGRAGDPHPRA